MMPNRTLLRRRRNRKSSALLAIAHPLASADASVCVSADPLLLRHLPCLCTMVVRSHNRLHVTKIPSFARGGVEVSLESPAVELLRIVTPQRLHLASYLIKEMVL